MTFRLPRWLFGALLLAAAFTLLAVTQDAHARRFGGGSSFGRQSTNIIKQRQAVTPPATQATPKTATPTAGATGPAAAGTAAKSGLSRWMGPIAGIAAGLGIAALLSSLGLSGAFLEFLSSALLIGLVLFAVMYLVRRLRGVQGPLAAASQGGSGRSYRQMDGPAPADAVHTGRAASDGAPVIEPAASVQAQDPSWFIPSGFDVPAFLAQAKQQFARIQGLWDAGERDSLAELLTDDLLIEITPRLPQPGEHNITEVVLLNAELLGIETVAGGHLASVRYSGMLREAAGAEAFRFEEVWNLYKAEGAGWLLAGIQQIDPR